MALCKGGSWTGTGSVLQNTNCRATANPRVAANTTTCDLRDYAPSWGGTAKPIVSATTGNLLSFSRSTHDEGVRILNLDLRGNGTAGWALWLWGDHTDYFVCNNTMTGWDLAFDMQYTSSGAPKRVHAVGNRILDSGGDAWLGGADGGSFDSNFLDNNGASNNRDHSVYLSGSTDADGPGEIKSFSFINNEIRYSTWPCLGSVLVVHGQQTNLNIENNIVDGGAQAGPGCWGISIDNGIYDSAGWYRNTTIRRNQVFNGGNLGIMISQNTDSIIENNVVVMSQSGRGIVSPEYAARTSMGEPAASGGTVRNNTVYFPAGTTSGSEGIVIGQLNEGTNWVIANNSVFFGGTGGTCFVTPRPSASYAFVGNNACYGGSWGTTYDATTHITANPFYTNPAGYDFTPQAGSPLNGAGSAARAPVSDLNLNTRPNPPAVGAVER